MWSLDKIFSKIAEKVFFRSLGEIQLTTNISLRYYISGLFEIFIFNVVTQ